MSAVTAFELPVKTPLPQITMTPKILGPFEVGFSAFHCLDSDSPIKPCGAWKAATSSASGPMERVGLEQLRRDEKR